MASNDHAAVSRRSFIRVAAGGAVILPGVLAACAAPAPASPTAAPAGAKPGGAAVAPPKPGSVLPAYLPLQSGPKPDYASAGEQYEDGWDNYPSPAMKSWTKGPPGMGGTISALSNAYNPPATPFDQ